MVSQKTGRTVCKCSQAKKKPKHEAKIALCTVCIRHVIPHSELHDKHKRVGGKAFMYNNNLHAIICPILRFRYAIYDKKKQPMVRKKKRMQQTATTTCVQQ